MYECLNDFDLRLWLYTYLLLFVSHSWEESAKFCTRKS